MFIGCFNRSVILTYIGLSAAIYGIYDLCMSTSSQLNINIVLLALICLVISTICDMFDGRIARMCKRNEIQKKFGVCIDSFCDVVSFLILPIAILFKVYLNSASLLPSFVYVCVAIFYVLAGITRLSWFNITDSDNGGYFKGVPVTSIALVLPLIPFIDLWLEGYFSVYLYPLVFVIMGLLFILNINIKKPSLKMSLFYLLLAIIYIVGLVFLQIRLVG